MTMGNVKKSLVEYAGRLEADIKAAKKKFEQTKQTDEFVNTFMELQKASLKAGFYLDKLDKNNFQYASLG